MTPYERLAAESVPTGTFGGAVPPRPTQRPERPAPTWTADEQARHCADLVAALDGWAWDEEQRDAERRHLRLITDQTNAA